MKERTHKKNKALILIFFTHTHTLHCKRFDFLFWLLEEWKQRMCLASRLTVCVFIVVITSQKCFSFRCLWFDACVFVFSRAYFFFWLHDLFVFQKRVFWSFFLNVFSRIFFVLIIFFDFFSFFLSLGVFFSLSLSCMSDMSFVFQVVSNFVHARHVRILYLLHRHRHHRRPLFHLLRRSLPHRLNVCGVLPKTFVSFRFFLFLFLYLSCYRFLYLSFLFLFFSILSSLFCFVFHSPLVYSILVFIFHNLLTPFCYFLGETSLFWMSLNVICVFFLFDYFGRFFVVVRLSFSCCVSHYFSFITDVDIFFPFVFSLFICLFGCVDYDVWMWRKPQKKIERICFFLQYPLLKLVSLLLFFRCLLLFISLTIFFIAHSFQLQSLPVYVIWQYACFFLKSVLFIF